MTEKSAVISRFAPSNTGFLHCGSARTALYSLATARANNGKCILRIEDTDAKRSTLESLKDIVNGLNWLGLTFDAGPSVDQINKGVFDPGFFQSRRTDKYNQVIQKLIDSGNAYIDGGVVKFKMPKMETSFKDEILGTMTIPEGQCEDFIIRKADGNPVFHLSVVVDDVDMGITHVVRGQDHISNTFKHLRIFEAMGAKVPKFAHIPLILDEKGAKLSKRRTDQFVLIKDFKAEGYLPEVIMNYLALLGWSPGNNIEEFDMEFMFQKFNLESVGKTNARFDYKKLINFNTTAISKMEIVKFSRRMTEYATEFYPKFMEDAIHLDIWDKMIASYKPRSKTLKDMFINGQFFLSNAIVYDPLALEKVMIKQQGYSILPQVMQELDQIDNWDGLSLQLAKIAEKLGLNMGKIAQPIRVAITGGMISPPIDDTMQIFGKSESMRRMKICLENKNHIPVPS